MNSKAQIKGVVTNNNKHPLPGAAVVCISLPDSIIEHTELTDGYGQYIFNDIKNGTYVIMAVAMGAKAYSHSFKYNSKMLIMPGLQIAEKSNQLDEVSVTAMLPDIIQKSDRIVVNIERMNTAGDNALEILKKAPGVRLDKDDNIMLKGNGGVTVMLNGKLSYMSGTTLSNYLKSLPAGAISKIEIIGNPPGNYDAEGTAGIINIILKRNRAPGYNGTILVTGGYGRYGKASGAGNLNYNTAKISLYTRFSYNYSESYNQLTLRRQIDDEVYDQVNYWHPISNTLSLTIGGNYNISKKSSLGLLLKAYNSDEKATKSTISKSNNATGEQTSAVNGMSNQVAYNNIYNAGINYTYAIDSNGKQISIDADHIDNNAINKQGYVNEFTDSSATVTEFYLRNNNPVHYTIDAIKADYTHPFATNWTLETGFKSSLVRTANNASFDSLKASGWIADPIRSSNFSYSEHINALYAGLNKTVGERWELKASLRAEHTNSIAKLITLDSVTMRSYLQFFPAAFVTFHTNKDHHINASYSRRISRQNYSALNPFIKYDDPYTAHLGNPYLKPSLSNSFGLGYTYKSFQVINLSYLAVKDAISRVIYQDDITKESINKFENLAKTGSFIISSAGSFKIRDWWSASFDIAASYDFVHSTVQGADYNSSQYAWTGSMEQNFILPRDVKLLLSLEYGSASVSGLEYTLPASQVDVGISKIVLKGKGTISFKARDIFFGNRYRSTLRYSNINTRWENEYESRRMSVSFSYRFGNDKIKAAKDHQSSTGTEAERIQ